MGYDPLLIDSSGSGGYHLWVLFNKPAPTADVYALAKGFAVQWESNNLDEEPEVFPKKVKQGSLGSWFRLPGLHHTNEHFGRIWSGDDWLEDPWLEGHAAIDAIVSCLPGPVPPSTSEMNISPRQTTIKEKSEKTKKASTRKARFKSTGKASICIDLDGVLADRTYTRGKTEIGEPIDGAVDFTRELAQFAEILILSARFSGIKNKTDIETMKNSIRKWLDQHKFSYTEIWTESAKPPAQAYIDDHGVYCCPSKEGLTAFNDAIISTKGLLKIEE